MKKLLRECFPIWMAGPVLFLYLFLPGGLSAQQGGGANHSIKGTITNDKGDPLAGASVRHKNSTRGISTDAAGTFTISAKAGDVLVISYVGYAETNYVVPGQGDIRVA